MNENEISQIGKSSSAAFECETIPPHRILVVDDDPCVRELSAGVLARCGYQVDLAQDGEAGWKALQAKNYNLLITDNNMPMLSGVELVMKLRFEDITLPVIMTSVAIPTDELKRHPWLQVAATLLKPFTVEELLGTVKRVLRAAGNARNYAEVYIPVVARAVSQTASLSRGPQ
jgi:DNA-binding response OmpR family regulator